MLGFVGVCLLLVAAEAVEFGPVQQLGQVHDSAVTENSGLAASRVHHNVLYGHNDHGDVNRIFALDPNTGAVLATLTITGATNHDWEDICVGTCGGSMASSSCIYIGDIGDGNGANPRTVYKVLEPQVLQSGSLTLVDKYTFTWSEVDAESLMIDPSGELYIISKIHGGNARFAHLPSSGWKVPTTVTVPDAGSAHLHLHTTSNDPQGADLSPDGLSLLVKTEAGLVYYGFTTAGNYAAQLSQMTPTDVTTYVRRHSGEAVAWNVHGTGFYTLPEGANQTFNFYTFSKNGNLVG